MLRSSYCDDTGIAVFQHSKDDSWKCLFHDSEFLKKAADTRLYRMNGEMVLSYNDDAVFGFPLTYRTLQAHPNFVMELGIPQKMLENFPTQKLEKNASLLVDDAVMYDFQKGRFCLIHHSEFFSTPVPLFERVENKFPRNIIFSMGTAAVPHGPDTFLAVGHVKIRYNRFYKGFDTVNRMIAMRPHKLYHPEWFYFMFVFEFNLRFQITRISCNFIPRDRRQKKNYLVFPTGLFIHQEKYYITYGENDTEMKMISFDHQEMEELLNDNQLHARELQCKFLKKNVVDMTPLIPKEEPQNSFFFNNSMIHWKDDLFLCVYRHVALKSQSKIYKNPMEIWFAVWNEEYPEDEIWEEEDLNEYVYGPSGAMVRNTPFDSSLHGKNKYRPSGAIMRKYVLSHLCRKAWEVSSRTH